MHGLSLIELFSGNLYTFLFQSNFSLDFVCLCSTDNRIFYLPSSFIAKDIISRSIRGEASFSPKEILAEYKYVDEREDFFEIGSVNCSGRHKLFILSFLRFIIMNPEKLSLLLSLLLHEEGRWKEGFVLFLQNKKQRNQICFFKVRDPYSRMYWTGMKDQK